MCPARVERPCAEGTATRPAAPSSSRARRAQTAASLTLPDRKRLEVARALATRPGLLLLDEVMAGLRPTETDRMVEILRMINREEGVTIFLVEQNAFHALKLADRGYVLVNGRVRLSGTGKELLANEEVRSAYLEGAAS